MDGWVGVVCERERERAFLTCEIEVMAVAVVSRSHASHVKREVLNMLQIYV